MDEKVAKTPRPHMLDADEVAELLRIKKGRAYEVFRSINAGAMDMTFSEFVEVYASEVKPRIREHTWITM